MRPGILALAACAGLVLAGRARAADATGNAAITTGRYFGADSTTRP